MSSVFAKVFLQAEKTFSIVNRESLSANLQILKKLIDEVEIKDLGINPHFTTKQTFVRKVGQSKYLMR